MDALDKAIEITADCPYRRTFHSDQGWAYQMKAYSHRLKEERIFQSMSRKGNCLDNSVMENFFGLLKSELLYLQEFDSMEHFKRELIEYVQSVLRWSAYCFPLLLRYRPVRIRM